MNIPSVELSKLTQGNAEQKASLVQKPGKAYGV